MAKILMEYDIKLETSIEEPLPTRATKVFCVAGASGKTACFLGDNMKAYRMDMFSTFLGLNRQALIQRYYRDGLTQDLLYNKPKKRGRKTGKGNEGNAAWRALGRKQRLDNLAKIKKSATFDSLIKDRAVKDENYGIADALRMQEVK